MKCIIVTGTSRGLGEAIITNLIDEDNILFCISRTENERLLLRAREKQAQLEYIKFDLLNLNEIESLLEKIFRKTKKLSVDSYYLINNAAILDPIMPIDRCQSKDIINNLNINLLAPMIITSYFIKMTNSFKLEKKVINISSGKNPFYGWGCYCSSKAAIDMFTRCTGIEQEKRPYPVKIISFNPGIMDTNMQEKIRKTSMDDFEQLERFVDFKEKGKLKSAQFVAGKVIEVLFDKRIISGSLLNINEL